MDWDLWPYIIESGRRWADFGHAFAKASEATEAFSAALVKVAAAMAPAAAVLEAFAVAYQRFQEEARTRGLSG